jgi:hypothetical protein
MNESHKLNRYSGFAILLGLILSAAVGIVLVEEIQSSEQIGKQIIYPQEHTK